MKIKLYFLPVIAFCILASCNKIIDIDDPKDSLVSSVVFKDENTAKSALNGLYNQYMATGLSFTNSLITITAGLSSDEIRTGTVNANTAEFLNNSISVGNSYISSLWGNPYLRIYQCNALLQGIDASKNLSSALKDRIKGEASFNRAFLYFYLVQLFGDVPLVLSTDYLVTATEPRTNKQKVYEQVEKDLLQAAELLTDDVSVGKTRPTRYAALALLSRLYLYQERWNECQKVSKEVLSSGKYSLMSDLTKVFLKESPEAILQFSPADGNAYVWEGFYFIPKTNAIPPYPIQDFLLESFSAADKRKSDWIGYKTVSGKVYSFAQKYRVGSGAGSASEYLTVLRFGEQFLIHAEASLRLGQLEEARADLNSIRKRAGLQEVAEGTIEENKIEELITDERRHELFCEWGHRWFDLIRNGKAQEALKDLKPGLTSNALLFPLPFTQIQTNPGLVQNPGY